MKPLILQSRFRRKLFHGVVAILVIELFSPVLSVGQTQQAQSQEMTTTTTSDTDQAPKLPPGQLDSLVAPIALYSDPLLAQTLAASTYPLEVIQLEQWMQKNKNLQGQALADAVAKQPWDASIQGLVAYPDVVTRMADNIQWTTDLGNAFLAQQSDVMGAVQRMRAKAQGTGNLKTSAQQVVQTETVPSGKQVITIEQPSPDVVYVPSYDPEVVYGAAPPAYPYYPYTYPGYVPGTALAWGAGIALGAAAWGAWGGHWGDCDWNGGDVNINNNNNFNRNANRTSNRNVNRGAGAGQGNKWQHNPQHRGNAPYGNRQTANKFGGQGARGAGNRPGGAGGAGRPGGVGGAGGVGGPGGVGGAGRPGGPGGAGGAGRPGGAGGAGRPGGPGGAGGAGRPGGAGGAGTRPGGGGAGARPGGGGAGAKPATRPAGGTAKNQVGNRSASSRPSASRGGGLSGGSGNYARASSSRGGHSMGGGGYSRGGGGYSRGGGMSRGGGGGGHRGGGGGRGGGGRGGGGGGRR